MNPHTAGKKSFALVHNKLVEMEAIETQMDTNDQSVDAFSAVMGPEHLGRLRLYGVGVTKTILKRKAGNSDHFLNATDDVVQQMQERMQKMEKQMEEQKKLNYATRSSNRCDEIEGDDRSTKDLT
ncbi:hypothetical protein MTR67_038376 [Solanum verrucosum]|uniref:Uncharacterized protein n=1 Tax=Solanum verrucosum TaxID=315347 RepID=A0AAF0UG68_SOLVR|nr:hypothetical protein MTR67_038376 [Solanum verrucosum]